MAILLTAAGAKRWVVEIPLTAAWEDRPVLGFCLINCHSIEDNLCTSFVCPCDQSDAGGLRIGGGVLLPYLDRSVAPRFAQLVTEMVELVKQSSSARPYRT